MTYGEAVDLSLRDLGLGVTEYSREQYDAQMLSYANAAVLELTKDCRPAAIDEVVAAVSGRFSVSDLQHPLYRLLHVKSDEREYHTMEEGGTIYICQDYTGDLKVTYEYYYDPALTRDDEIPLPAQYHQLIPLYISAKFLLSNGGDKTQLSRAQTNMSLFSQLRNNLRRPQHGATSASKLKNRGW